MPYVSRRTGTVTPPAERDPRFVESGRRGARLRYGPPRVARLDSLAPAMRAVVLALIAAAKETAPTNETSGAVTTGGTRDADRQT
jgi:hypothetical protein